MLVEGRTNYEERGMGVHYGVSVGWGFACQWESLVLGKVRLMRRFDKFSTFGIISDFFFNSAIDLRWW